MTCRHKSTRQYPSESWISSMTPIFVINSQWVSIVMNVQCRSLLQIYAEYTCFYFCPEKILSVFKLPGDTTITHSCKQQKYRKWPNMFCVYISVLLISVQIYIAAVTKTSSMLTHCFWGAMSKLVPSIASVRASSATTTTFLIAKGPNLMSLATALVHFPPQDFNATINVMNTASLIMFMITYKNDTLWRNIAERINNMHWSVCCYIIFGDFRNALYS